MIIFQVRRENTLVNSSELRNIEVIEKNDHPRTPLRARNYHTFYSGSKNLVLKYNSTILSIALLL